MTRRILILLSALLAVSPALAGPCDGRYAGMVTVKGAQGVSTTELQWTVRDTRLYGAFEGPNGLFLIEAQVDARCAIVKGAANDYAGGDPLPMTGSVTDGNLRHHGPVEIVYRMRRME